MPRPCPFPRPTRLAPVFLVAAAVPFLLPIRAAAQAAVRVPAQTEARLRALYAEGGFAARSFDGEWLADGSGWARLEEGLGRVQELVRYDPATGARTVIAGVDALRPPGASTAVAVDDWAVSADGGVLLLRAGGAARGSELWLLERPAGTLRKVAEGVDGGGLGGALSPDGRRVLFERDEDLFVTDLAGARTVALTKDGEPDAVSSGSAVWSPDGRRVAFVRRDVTALPQRAMLEPVDPSYPHVRQVRFARVGQPIPRLRVGVVDAGGGEPSWVPLPEPPEGFYLGAVRWSGERELLVEQLSRGRDARTFFLFDSASGELRRLYAETDPAWVVASYAINIGLDTAGQGRWVLTSEKDGWRHAWLLSPEGEERALLTPGAFDVVGRGPVDARGGWLYYYASPGNATQRYLWRARLDGNHAPERVTPEGRPGWHEYEFSPDLRWAFHTYSDFDTPPVVELVSLPDHRVVRVLEDNRALREKVEPLLAGNTEFLEVDIGGGVVMDAWMIRPRDFDPSRKYPLFVYVYGEPHAQTVLDRWSGNQLYHQIIADLGYVVLSMDNRGTPAPKGAAWRRASFPTLGTLSTEEQAAGVQALGRARPYVDLSRVGTWGWSGGGSNTLNAMFRRPDVFHMGIAVAPKPQPHLYNAWFQEIYMRTLEENAEGYRRSSPLHHAEGLAGHLLIVHGTGETNTHLEITEGLVDRLIALGKTFDYMTYPNRNHGISEGEGTSLHLRLLMARYLLEHLPPGAR